MNIIGITKIRNEEEIIKETLDHWGGICTGGIYICDDSSIDNTVNICKEHPAVKGIEIVDWDSNREKAEWYNRQVALEMAMKNAGKDDWFVCFDADERLYNFNKEILNSNAGAVACQLYDLYITPEDKDRSYQEREWVGPEFRTIVFFFKNSPYLSYDTPDQRVVNLDYETKYSTCGKILHLSKGLGTEEWEKTCDYYANYWPKYAEKWKKRKGKAIHSGLSDFGNKLIKFSDVLLGKECGFSLEDKPYGQN